MQAISRTLLEHAIDYAGLFPPASHPMSAAVREYREIRGGPEAWALGRFVVPAGRLTEFRDAGGGAWRLAAIAGNELAKDIDGITRFNDPRGSIRAAPAAVVDTVEFRVITPEALRDAMVLVPESFHRFAEWPLGADPQPFVAAVAGTGMSAKFRTGGIVEDAFPEANMLLNHLAAVLAAGVPFKCTAGLHHPVRGRYRLTYDIGGAQGMMYGWLNVMLAALALRKGLSRVVALAILLEEDGRAFRIGTTDIRWNDVTFTQAEVAGLRHQEFLSFGSCSFREPVDELPLVTGT